MVHDWGEVVTR